MPVYNFIYPNFSANLASSKLKFAPKDFYVNIRGYGKNENWADEVIKTADLGSSLIVRGTSAENVLKIITKGIKKANSFVMDLGKRSYTGILRVNRENWLSDITDVYTSLEIERYSGYASRLAERRSAPLEHVNKNLAMTRPMQDVEALVHGDPLRINESLDYVIKLYKELFPKYIDNAIQPSELEQVNHTIAEIRWVLAHATPWIRGSDAISNVFMRAIYKAIGIKTYPLAKGVSLDLEAYCTELKDYQKKFSTYFTKPPEIVD